MKAPIVTVFMAAYNAEEFIEKSVISILDQSFKNFELIIVNDGSTDNTVGLIEQIKDPRIKLVHNKENIGLQATRNRLLDLATGKYIAILDSDDIASPDRLEAQVSFLEDHSEIALCGGHADVIDENNKPTGIKYIQPCDETLEVFMLFGNPFINSSVLFRRDVFVQLGGYRDYAPAEDFDLFARIAAKHKIANLNKTLVKYRIHQSNISKKENSLQIKNEERILENLRSDLGLTPNNHTSAVHLSIYKGRLDHFSFKDYAEFLIQLKRGNRQTGRYDQDILDGFLFNKWFEIIREKKAKNAIALLFKKAFFNWKYVTSKQLRKAFKQSFFLALSR